MGVLCLFIANVSLTLCARRLQPDLGCIPIAKQPSAIKKKKKGSIASFMILKTAGESVVIVGESI